jgi:single-strand DNA-binding protein
MEILVGRLTADAKVSTLKDDRQVVNFSIAMNDSFKAKGSDSVKQVVTYVNCAYWRSTGVAKYLTRGTIVKLSGRIGVRAWNNMKGEAQATLEFFTSEIKLFGNPKGQSHENKPVETATSAETDDLPF